MSLFSLSWTNSIDPALNPINISTIEGSNDRGEAKKQISDDLILKIFLRMEEFTSLKTGIFEILN